MGFTATHSGSLYLPFPRPLNRCSITVLNQRCLRCAAEPRTEHGAFLIRRKSNPLCSFFLVDTNCFQGATWARWIQFKFPALFISDITRHCPVVSSRVFLYISHAFSDSWASHCSNFEVFCTLRFFRPCTLTEIYCRFGQTSAVTFTEYVDHSESVLKICQATRRLISLKTFCFSIKSLAWPMALLLLLQFHCHWQNRKFDWQKTFTWRHAVCCRKWRNLNLTVNCVKWNFLFFCWSGTCRVSTYLLHHRAWCVTVPTATVPVYHRA